MQHTTKGQRLQNQEATQKDQQQAGRDALTGSK